jgi:hypothetical protein
MRRNLLPVIVALCVLCGVGWMVFTELTHRERNVQKIEVPESYLETMDTSRYSIQSILLERQNEDDSLIILFPESNERSVVYLYDQKNYYRMMLGYSDFTTIPQENKEILKALFNRPVVNLSGLKEGKYYLHATTCNFGGFFEITISDHSSAQ